ncbi:MAG TPA: ABC transporter permease, partial [Terriglobia bacterium]|nr:ABC transporter permease [Terriglobia bacterium]
IVGAITLDGVEFSYRRFILSGIVAQALLFQGFFEAGYGSFIRMYYQRIFQAIAVTPITLSEVLWAELIWDASKATFAASAVLLIGILIGDFRPLGALAALPLCFVGALMFASMGLWVAAKSRTIEEISYPQYLFVFPMFLFCGVFFPISSLPVYLQWFARLLPLTPIVSLLRALTLGATFQVWDIPVVLVWLLAAAPLARRAMSQRLIK